MFEKMIENRYKKRYEAQKNINVKQKEKIKSLEEQIDSLEAQIQNLEKKCEEKDELINCVEPMRNELAQIIDGCKNALAELNKMKTIANKELYKGRWWLVRFLIK